MSAGNTSPRNTTPDPSPDDTSIRNSAPDGATSSVLVRGDPRGADDIVVFLPPAGSVTTPYLPVASCLPDSVAAVHCEMPGRGRLAHDTAPTAVAACVDRWDADLLALSLEGRLHFFGHSLGALFAHELVARCEARASPRVASLCVSAARQPGSAPRMLIANAFEALRGEQGGAGRAEDKDAWLTDDLRMRRRHRVVPQPVRAPLALFCPSADPFARPHEMEDWKNHTSGPCLETFTFRGGHDYYRSAPDEVAAAIGHIVERTREPHHAQHHDDTGV
ncbi:thioesterase domain-containing protein [Streptomyces sp. NBC_01471]|uniref:thioesterase II family protein n=1 Tax=Streptomyces sp. NBC_01471 TaxID=2903879 RepID=UPI0032506CED